MWKRSKWEHFFFFYQSRERERWRHLILDIFKAPEVYCSSLTSSLKTTFTAGPFYHRVLMQLCHKGRKEASDAFKF